MYSEYKLNKQGDNVDFIGMKIHNLQEKKNLALTFDKPLETFDLEYHIS